MIPRLGDVALGVLAVLTVVLLVLVVGPQRDLPGDQPPESPAPTAEPSGSASPGEDASEDTPSEDPDEAPAEDPDDAPRPDGDEGPRPFARVADQRDGVLVHAGVARCRSDAGDAAVVVVTGERRPVPGLTTVTGVQMVDASSLRVVGADADCAAVTLRSSDLGQTWEPADQVGFWSLVPDEEAGVAHPSGRAGLPCTPVSVSGVDAGVARVLCDNGRVLGTADTGDTWVPLGGLPGGLTISFASPSLGYALVEDDDCAGPRVRRTTDGGASWSDLDCVGTRGPWALTAEGEGVLVVGRGGRRTSVDDDRSTS